MENQEDDNQLSRGLKNRHVQLIALGGTIGTGLFLGAGQSIHLAGPSIILAYGIAGLACFLLMRALGELLVSDVESNSFVFFIKKYLGEKMGFVIGWTYWMCWIAIAMAEVTASGLYVQFWFPKIPIWLTGLVLLLILFIINIIAVSAFGETEFWLAIVKIVAIVALILIGIVLVAIHFKTPYGHASLMNVVDGGFFANGAKGFVLSFQMVLFSFAGIEMIGMTASETQDPLATIPKSINEVPTRVLLFYIGSLLALMSIFPWQHVSPTSSPFVQVFAGVGIQSAAVIINFVVLTAAISACNSSLFTTGRMLFSLTYNGKSKFSQKVGHLSHRQIPFNAILFSTLVIAVIVLLSIMMPGDVFSFISSVATTCFLFVWGMIVLAHIKYRNQVKKAGKEKQLKFKMPLFPIADYFVLIFMAFVAVVLTLKTDTLIALVGSIIWLMGLFIFKSLTDKVKEIEE
ncbi:amino acid permease-associated protein [Lentilactobacillus otakiensis DSM 19908 = JCM 15040]|uniref:Amino acid permease-associated protein n=1 Tax=Lentilactobacillus otakiensis DSM 19908 = JCM 15040 TaxID=1423780 RepID=S4PNK1_9LACO|nr:amino acid permease [Lentilactobacillus otakiensis]KRL09069.1 amino acid permease-associated protein [Lentilactobacillus otakiensis DSM 19908 = JCM 15040]GAD15935.1 amino acid permease-associated protein [Lentilactobacillus otakiensis DSM 19908 = JCM 15040]